MNSGETTHFGFEEIPLGEKQARVDDVFHKVAARYDRMNDAMSLGLHRLWRQVLIGKLRPPRDRPFRVLDVAGGTGDIGFRILEAGGPRTEVVILDINASMLEVGEARAAKRGHVQRLHFVEGNAESLDFPDASFDAYTIAFGMRNVPRRELALHEARRVLKRGGHFLCLELAPVDMPGLDRLYEAYSFHLIPQIGRLVTGEAAPYQYLVESIRRFPPPEAFAAQVQEAGFAAVSHQSLSGGIANIHSAWKI